LQKVLGIEGLKSFLKTESLAKKRQHKSVNALFKEWLDPFLTDFDVIPILIDHHCPWQNGRCPYQVFDPLWNPDLTAYKY
jgi:hypothetical protein